MTKTQGPIEQELRHVSATWTEDQMSISWPCRVSDRTLQFTINASRTLGCHAEFLHTRTADREVLSEAIQAAEALGL